MSQVMQHTSMLVARLAQRRAHDLRNDGRCRSSQARKSREHPCAQRHLMTGPLNLWRGTRAEKATIMWDGNKKLDSLCLTPYHTPMLGGARSLGAAGATEGPARQLWPATLASPPLHEA